MFNQDSKPVLQYQYRYAATDDESGQKLEKVVVVKKKQRWKGPSNLIDLLILQKT